MLLFYTLCVNCCLNFHFWGIEGHLTMISFNLILVVNISTGAKADRLTDQRQVYIKCESKLRACACLTCCKLFLQWSFLHFYDLVTITFFNTWWNQPCVCLGLSLFTVQLQDLIMKPFFTVSWPALCPVSHPLTTRLEM